MAKGGSVFVCQSCGTVVGKWQGQCPGCGAWNSIVEEATSPAVTVKAKGGRKVAFVGLDGEVPAPPRLRTGISELDRVCGGGLVAGSALLVGGDPGIGKSTLLLQVAAALAKGAAGTAQRVAYVTGEEAVAQVRLRAERLGLADAPVLLAAATDLREILAGLDVADAPRVAIIDSIQTLHFDALDSAPGSVAQVRACAQELIKAAKSRGFVLVLVGHVTKEGNIAGPRVLEHMVDAVLYFEGDRGHQFRLLRAVKNRFGATDELGVFAMTDAGLAEVVNPSALFLQQRRGHVSGCCVFAGMEGTRPMLMEIQALVAPSGGGSPRRAVVGWDGSRLAMLLAVLEARCGLALGGSDVYLNVAGGLRIAEPAADLAVAAALASAAADRPVPADLVAFGEVGLSGEVRRVAHRDLRLKEAAKLGFTAALAPAEQSGRKGGRDAADHGIAVDAIGHLHDLLRRFAAGPASREAAPGKGS